MPKKDISSLFVPKFSSKPYTVSRYRATTYNTNSGSEDVVQYLATQRQLLHKTGADIPIPAYAPETTLPKQIVQLDQNDLPQKSASTQTKLQSVS